MREIGVVTDPVIIGFVLPKWTTNPAEHSVRLDRSERFPTVQYGIESIRAERANNGMHMVWHDAPSVYDVPLASEMENGTGNNRGDVGLTEPGCTCVLVERGIHLARIPPQQVFSGSVWFAGRDLRGTREQIVVPLF